mmetsp:Transcript_23719/g.46600  ORF Transcript_23719/g.46600 Transcript_23719/m.46600 type:complete len:87 (-) Transcript_23719:561-821(-)
MCASGERRRKRTDRGGQFLSSTGLEGKGPSYKLSSTPIKPFDRFSDRNDEGRGLNGWKSFRRGRKIWVRGKKGMKKTKAIAKQRER